MGENVFVETLLENTKIKLPHNALIARERFPFLINTQSNAMDHNLFSVQIHGKARDFTMPSQYTHDDVHEVLNKPSAKLALEWVYGYRGYDSRMNLYCLPSGELCYYVGAVAVLYDRKVEVQRHYTGHNQDITR